MKKLRWIAVALVLMIGALAYSIRPGTLYIRIVESPWTSLTLSSPSGKTISYSPGDAIRFWPVQYGIHKVTITFPDQRTAWLRYYHYDAGVRKRAEMIIQRLPDGESLRITQIYNKSEKVERTIRISETSQEQPVHIDGPAG
ncbi:MAG TPA: hypothetical protein DCM05_07615 [Elusimicrobia bacterium]|nr:hypothetical protein [Elusimicrobiota bacterium]